MKAQTQLRELRISLPSPHAGQASILKQAARFNVVRCGRRFGKTTLGEHEARRWWAAGMKVGWFAPTYKILEDAWATLLGSLRPHASEVNKAHRRMINPLGGVLECWSLDTDDPARSRDYDLVIIDEAGLVPNLGRIWRQCIRPTLVDRRGSMAWMLGTPRVISPDFNTFFEQAELQLRGFEAWRAFRAKTVDNPHLNREDIEEARATMDEWEYLQEFEGVPCDVSAGFFPRSEVEQHRSRHALDPFERAEIICTELDLNRRDMAIRRRDPGQVAMVPDRIGPWRLWLDLEDGRPYQHTQYAIAADLSNGVGSSNTVISVGDINTGRKVAEFVSPRITPDEAARIMVLASTWFGGEAPAILNFEANGPGSACAQELVRLQYPRLYKATEDGTRKDHHHKKTRPELGWWNVRDAKETLLTNYKAALRTDRFINPSDKALDECLLFRLDKQGKIVSDAHANDPMEELARLPHGDRVIADAVLHLTMASAPKGSGRAGPKPPAWVTPTRTDRFKGGRGAETW